MRRRRWQFPSRRQPSRLRLHNAPHRDQPRLQQRLPPRRRASSDGSRAFLRLPRCHHLKPRLRLKSARTKSETDATALAETSRVASHAVTGAQKKAVAVAVAARMAVAVGVVAEAEAAAANVRPKGSRTVLMQKASQSLRTPEVARRSRGWTAHLRTDSAMSRGKSDHPGTQSVAGAAVGANEHVASAPVAPSRALPRMNAVSRGRMDARSAVPIATARKAKACQLTSSAARTSHAPMRAHQLQAR